MPNWISCSDALKRKLSRAFNIDDVELKQLVACIEDNFCPEQFDFVTYKGCPPNTTCEKCWNRQVNNYVV